MEKTRPRLTLSAEHYRWLIDEAAAADLSLSAFLDEIIAQRIENGNQASINLVAARVTELADRIENVSTQVANMSASHAVALETLQSLMQGSYIGKEISDE